MIRPRLPHFVAGLLCASATAQTLSRTYYGDAASARLGARFDVVGDLTGDGLPEILAGYPDDDTSGTDAGRALVLSGADGSVLLSFFGDHPGDRSSRSETSAWERASLGAGDLDGDGRGEVAVSDPAGAFVDVYSALDGHLVQRLSWAGPASYGADLASFGDVDGDGHADLGVGWPVDDTAGVDAGSIQVWSGNRCGPGETYCIGAPNSVGDGARMRYSGSTSVVENELALFADACPPGQAGLFYYAL